MVESTTSGRVYGQPRTLLAELAGMSHCRSVDRTGRAGCPRVREKIEEMDAALSALGHAVQAIPAIP